jgi:hypothetical protein
MLLTNFALTNFAGLAAAGVRAQAAGLFALRQIVMTANCRLVLVPIVTHLTRAVDAARK